MRRPSDQTSSRVWLGVFQDPKGERVKVVRSALVKEKHIVAIFWDWASLPQAPRSPKSKEMFGRALSGINEVYASAIGTAVLQLREIPQRPTEYDGWVCLFGVAAGSNETAVRAAFERFGGVKSVSLEPDARVCFYTHESACAAKREGSLDGVCDGIDTEYNETSYAGRRGEVVLPAHEHLQRAVHAPPHRAARARLGRRARPQPLRHRRQPPPHPPRVVRRLRQQIM